MAGLGVYRVFVDSSVFYSRTLRDWLGLIYTCSGPSPYTVYWSEDVLAEVVYHLRRNHLDWDGGRISAIRDRLTEVFEIGRVADYTVVPVPGFPDPNDLHVHSAAIACGADILLTCNDKDFPQCDHYDVMTPDEFFVLVNESAPNAVREATVREGTYWGRRGGEVDLPGRLRAAGCDEFAARVLAHLREIALHGE